MTATTALSSTPINNEELNFFVEYCLSSYGENGFNSDVFDTPVTRERIVEATLNYIQHINEGAFGADRTFECDGFDREIVRDYMLGSSDVRGTLNRGLEF